MKRDFSCESAANSLLRVCRATTGRLRGFLYRRLWMFADGTKTGIVFGAHPRLLNTKAMQFGQSVHFGLMARLECYGGMGPGGEPRLRVGDGTSFGDYCHIGAANKVVIGRHVLGASGILILDHSHGNPKEDLIKDNVINPKMRGLMSRGEIVVGDNVWIGEGAIILAGSRIGEAAIIAARAIVRGEVPARSIYYGE